MGRYLVLGIFAVLMFIGIIVYVTYDKYVIHTPTNIHIKVVYEDNSVDIFQYRIRYDSDIYLSRGCVYDTQTARGIACSVKRFEIIK